MGCCGIKGYSRRVVWDFICVVIFISIIIILLIGVLRHSCGATFMEGRIKIFIVGKVVNKQRFIAVSYTPYMVSALIR